jgi:D-inositol-3-phosphate glycosyltransferase
MDHSSPQKPTVLAVGLFVPGTGFTRVFESLFAHLHQWFNIHWLGIGYKGAVKSGPYYTLHPNNLKGGDIYGAYGAARLARELDARSVLLLSDLYLLKNYAATLTPLREEGRRLLVYAPLDGYIQDPELARSYFFADDLVLYTRWSRGELERAAEALRLEHSTRLHTAYHGVDQEFFRPAEGGEQQKLKESLFRVPGAAEAVFVLNANRLNERKDIFCTLDAFALALPRFTRPAYLCLHLPSTPETLLDNLRSRIATMGLGDKVLLNPIGNGYSSDIDLRSLYQACDIGINTCLGEGWGLVSFEHACCGGAQLVPAHTAPAEVWKDAGILLPLSGPVQLQTNPFLMYSVSPHAAAGALCPLVNNDALLREKSVSCRVHALQEIFNWKEIAGEWRRSWGRGSPRSRVHGPQTGPFRGESFL